jgi:hypothetical protein
MTRRHNHAAAPAFPRSSKTGFEPAIPPTAASSSPARRRISIARPGDGYTGQGIGVAVLDTGVAPLPDLRSRIIVNVDFTGQAVRQDGGQANCGAIQLADAIVSRQSPNRSNNVAPFVKHTT